jgi:hypothetical protein
VHLHTLLVQWDVISKHGVWRLLRVSRAAVSLVRVHPLYGDIQIRLAMYAAQRLLAVDLAKCMGAFLCLLQLDGLHLCALRIFSRLEVRSAVGCLIRRAVIRFGEHVVFRPTLGKAHNKRGHGHFDVEFDDVDDGMELDVDHLILEKHETDQQGLRGRVSM